MSHEKPACGTSDGEHLFESCTCGDPVCPAAVCIWCELIIVESRPRSVNISALNEYDLG